MNHDLPGFLPPSDESRGAGGHPSKPRRRLQPALFPSATDEWPTLWWFFEALDREFAFTLDPCATPQNAKSARYFTREQNGLLQDWSQDVVFMNPPYGREIGAWVEKAYRTSLEGGTVVALLPSRTDARWWHRFVMRGEIRLLCGRLTFEGGRHPAPFPSAVVVFRPHPPVLRSMPARSGGPKCGCRAEEMPVP